jgi:AcrR family transcriptional regulator
MRDRVETEKKLIAAAGQVLARDGFKALGVNAVAREAGVDKVLIYRYFDGLPGLIQAYARQGDFWPGVDELLGEPIEDFKRRSPADQMATILENHAAGIRRRPLTLKILAWEMVDRNELTAHLEEIREQQGVNLTEALGGAGISNSLSVDINAIAAIFAAGINYLAARSQKIRIFNGVEIKEDDGWKRLTGSIRTLCENSL